MKGEKAGSCVGGLRPSRVLSCHSRPGKKAGSCAGGLRPSKVLSCHSRPGKKAGSCAGGLRPSRVLSCHSRPGKKAGSWQVVYGLVGCFLVILEEARSQNQVRCHLSL